MEEVFSSYDYVLKITCLFIIGIVTIMATVSVTMEMKKFRYILPPMFGALRDIP